MFERGTILHVDIYIYMYLLASDATCSGDKCAQHVPPPVSSGDRSSGDSYAARQTVVRQATPFFCLFPTVGHDTRLCPPTVIACYCGPPHPILSCGQYYIIFDDFVGTNVRYPSHCVIAPYFEDEGFCASPDNLRRTRDPGHRLTNYFEPGRLLYIYMY